MLKSCKSNYIPLGAILQIPCAYSYIHLIITFVYIAFILYAYAYSSTTKLHMRQIYPC